MVNYPRWAIVVTIVIALLGLIYASPNFFPQADEAVEASGVLPSQRMNLGLDLQGGSSLLLSVGVDTAIRETLESVESTVRRELRQRGSRIGYSGLRVEGKAIAFTLRDAADAEAARDRLRNLEDGFELEVTDDVNFRLVMSEDAEAARRQSAVEQSIEIVRRRVDETGVAEPVIQQQGQDRILVQLPGIKDPERIKRLLGQTAKLNFHMLDESVSIQEAENGNLPAGSMLLFSPEEEGRIPYVVRRTVEVAGDRLVDAQPTFQDGQPIVSFRFDAAGGRRFGELTAENV
ncbi:MAG: protein translocase subunit SecD, partial [Alphaproteobacteria bacterium]